MKIKVYNTHYEIARNVRYYLTLWHVLLIVISGVKGIF